MFFSLLLIVATEQLYNNHYQLLPPVWFVYTYPAHSRPANTHFPIAAYL
jgi:hypothetical protein